MKNHFHQAEQKSVDCKYIHTFCINMISKENPFFSYWKRLKTDKLVNKN